VAEENLVSEMVAEYQVERQCRPCYPVTLFGGLPGVTQQINFGTKNTFDMTVSFTNKINGLQSPISGIMTDFSSEY
jgi:hypothetical protein